MPETPTDDKNKHAAGPEKETQKPSRPHQLTVGLGMSNDVSLNAYFKLNPGTSRGTKIYTDGQLSHQNNFEVYNDRNSFVGNWSIYTPHLKVEANPLYAPPDPLHPRLPGTPLTPKDFKYLSDDLIGERPYIGVFDASAAHISHADPKKGTINYQITGAQVFAHDPSNFTEKLQNAVHTNSHFPLRDYSTNPGERELVGVNMFAERAYGKRIGHRDGLQAEAVGAIGGSAGIGMRDFKTRDISMKYGTNAVNAGLSLGVGQHLNQLPIESLPIGAENATTHHFTGTGAGNNEKLIAWRLGARYVQSVSFSNHTMIPERDIKTPAPQYPVSSGIQNVPFLHTNPHEPQQKEQQKFGPLAGTVDLTATLAVKRVLAEFGVSVPVNDPTNHHKVETPGVEDKIITPRLKAKIAYRF